MPAGIPPTAVGSLATMGWTLMFMLAPRPGRLADRNAGKTHDRIGLIVPWSAIGARRPVLVAHVIRVKPGGAQRVGRRAGVS